jgi:Family of unknown function (DUF6228)
VIAGPNRRQSGCDHAAVDVVTIGSHETKLELRCVDRRADGAAELLRARLVAPGLDVERDAYEFEGYAALAGLFDEMASSWRGWDGERTFYSLEGDLEITATHDGHVRLLVRLSQFSGPGEWTVHAKLTIDPGEDLTAAADSVRSLIDGDSL